MKNKKTDPRTILIGKRVIVRKTNFSLRFLIERINGNLFEGPVEVTSPDCPFPVDSIYSVSENEIKYCQVIS